MEYSEATMRNYEEWKAARLERVPGRCGGRPTFKGSRLQPHDIVGDGSEESLALFGLTIEDYEHSHRFVVEEPHWKLLARGIDWNGRELSDTEYAELEAQFPRR